MPTTRTATDTKAHTPYAAIPSPEASLKAKPIPKTPVNGTPKRSHQLSGGSRSQLHRPARGTCP